MDTTELHEQAMFDDRERERQATRELIAAARRARGWLDSVITLHESGKFRLPQFAANVPPDQPVRQVRELLDGALNSPALAALRSKP